MRTIVDIPEEQLKALESLGKEHSLSRAELVRRAIADYVENHLEGKKMLLDKYFGIMKGSSSFDGMDGLGWQKKMRGEWNKREGEIDRRIAESRAQGFHEPPQQPFKDK